MNSRVATSLLRTGPRLLPFPGWFPVVVEPLHRLVAGDLEEAEVVTRGVRMRLDLRDYIQRRIFYESHEPRELAFTERFLRPGDVVLDVGGHVGIFTLVAASAVGNGGEVHTFEPVPQNFRMLEENVRLNGFTQVHLNRTAVGAELGEASFGLPEVVPDLGETSAMYTSGGTVRPVKVPVTTLDAYVGEHLGSKPIRLLKIDVEGLEPAVLAGFERRLADDPPDAILLEVNLEMLARQETEGRDVVDRLRKAGYRLYRANVLGRLRELDFELDGQFDPERDVPEQAPGLGGWVRRYRSESRIFFNLFALQSGAGSR